MRGWVDGWMRISLEEHCGALFDLTDSSAWLRTSLEDFG